MSIYEQLVAEQERQALLKMKNPLIDSMVDDFLRWPLPDSVCADGCATKQGPGRVGTSLLTAIEAEAMFNAVALPVIERLNAAKVAESVRVMETTASWNEETLRLGAEIERLREALTKLPVDAVTRAALEAIRDDNAHSPSVQTLFGRNLAKALTAQ